MFCYTALCGSSQKLVSYKYAMPLTGHVTLFVVENRSCIRILFFVNESALMKIP